MFNQFKASLKLQWAYPQILWTITWIVVSLCIGFGMGELYQYLK